MASKTCAICGKPSGMYPLCKECFQLRDEGKVEQCPDCKKWHYSTEKCNCDKTSSQNSPCPICGKLKENNKEYCDGCYQQIQTYVKDINKNQSIFALKDHYYNLKSSIYRLRNNQYILNNIYKLNALALTVRNIHKNTILTEKVLLDTQQIIEKKNITFDNSSEEEKIESNKITAEEIINDTINIAISNINENRARDGHLCASAQEVAIDDYFYSARIVHAYNQVVKEIPEEERTLVADWYIPIDRKGVYVEYWGIDNKQDYQDNKEEKLQLYKKYNIPLIEIDKHDLKDTQTMETHLYRELKKFGYKD